MTTLPNMSIVLPTLGGDSGTWDTLLNNALGLLDEHDHRAGAGKRIVTSALNIDADLTLAGYALTNAGKIGLSAVTALASGARQIFCNVADNELYWRTNSGTNVKLTNGTSINTSLVGGIVGDYTSVGAEVAYDDANDRYTFKQQGSPKTWARLASGGVRLYETGTSETVYVGLKAPSGLGSSYDVTLPTAAPGVSAPLFMDTAGVISAPLTPTFEGGLISNGDVILGGGVIENADNAPINMTDGVLGADFFHGDYEITIPGIEGQPASSSGWLRGSAPVALAILTNTTVFYTIPLRVGDQIKSVTISRFGDGSADITTFGVIKTSAAGVDASIGSTSVTNPAASWADSTLNVTDTVLASGETLTLILVTNATGISIGNVRITYDRPVP